MLNQWSLELSSAVAALTPIELKESPAPRFPMRQAAALSDRWQRRARPQSTASRCPVDITHTWIGDLRVSVRSPSGTEAILHDGAGGSADNVVRTFTAANAPPLRRSCGTTGGRTWQLNVVDRAAQDEGKLNAWKVLIKPVRLIDITSCSW
jgi:hypothetical protein